MGVPHEPLAVSAADLVIGSSSLAGHSSGTAEDSADALRFAAMSGVCSMIETYPLGKAGDGFDRMMPGSASFRIVLIND